MKYIAGILSEVLICSNLIYLLQKYFRTARRFSDVKNKVLNVLREVLYRQLVQFIDYIFSLLQIGSTPFIELRVTQYLRLTVIISS